MAGQVQFKADRFGMVHVGVGKVDFPLPSLLENVRVMMVALSNAKPEGAKGKYIKVCADAFGWVQDEDPLTAHAFVDHTH